MMLLRRCLLAVTIEQHLFLYFSIGVQTSFALQGVGKAKCRT